MYAIVEIAGQQFKVEEGKKIFVHRLETEKDTILEFDRVLLVEDNNNILVGEPTIENFIVEGKVLDHVRGDKVIVFKKKKKKGYRVKNGHRQNFSEVEIIGIGERGTIVRKESIKKEKVKKVVEPEEGEVAETKTREKKPAAKTAVKKEAATKAKKPAEKKEAEKKEAEKKPAAKKVSKKKE